MSNAELFDHLIETDPTFRERYRGLAETIASEEGGFFSKSWAWIAKKSIKAKEWQDKTLENTLGVSKKIIFVVGFAFFAFIIVKFDLLKNIKQFLRSF